MMNVTIIRVMAAGLMGLTIVGCQNKDMASWDAGPNGPFIPPEGETRSVELTMNRQIARGAAADGMLYAAHFDGDVLNSLGRQKLDNIVAGTSANAPVTVHLNLLGDESVIEARRTAVSDYLASLDVPADRIVLETGDNPATRHLASIDGAKLYKVESGTMTGVKVELDDGGESSSGKTKPLGSSSQK